MPLNDKRGLPSLITKGIGTDLTRRRVMQGALSTVAKDLIPFAAKEILAAKDFNSLQKIKEVKPLLTKYFTITKQIDSLPEKIWGKKVLEERVHDDYITSNVDSYNAGRSLYKELIYVRNERDALQKRYNKYLERFKKEGFDPEEFSGIDQENVVLAFEEVEKELGSANEDYKQLISIIASPESALGKKDYRFSSGVKAIQLSLKHLDKKSIQFIKENLALDHQLQDIKIEAADKKVPFTLFAKFISNDLYRKSNVTNKDIQESIKKIISNDPKWGKGKQYFKQEEYIRKLSTPKGLAEEVEKDYQFYKNTPEGGVKGWRTSTQDMTPQEAEQWQKQAIEKFLRSKLENLKHIYESNPNTGIGQSGWDTRHLSFGIHTRSDPLIYNFMDDVDYGKYKKPLEEKQRIEDIKEDIKKAAIETAKTLAKDYVKDKFVTREGQKLKPGPWTQKIADYLKSSRTPSGPTIESDKTRISKAKVVEEVKKTETKKEVKPSSNLTKKLKTLGAGLSRKLKYSPTGLVLYATKIDPEGTSELPLDPRAIEIERALERGRVSRDPYKNYNTQRAI